MGQGQPEHVGAASHLDAWGGTYRITNLRGLIDNTGNRVKHMTKHARAARLQAPKINKRSQRLTVDFQVSCCHPTRHTDGSHAEGMAWLRCNVGLPLQGCREKNANLNEIMAKDANGASSGIANSKQRGLGDAGKKCPPGRV